ncbi:Ribose-phosphate pyrophosphokinase 1 [Platanthera zijinensis]|uniref:Ribose-phosphate pyrophosphokinase 1 n=1 Tax=Platanthera zijinensis TaxID=2320716 RepID=A0AAP0B3U5_9ASPA
MGDDIIVEELSAVVESDIHNDLEDEFPSELPPLRRVGKIEIKMFYDKNIAVLLPDNVEGCNVFLVQPTCPPISDNFMELCNMIDVCCEGSTEKITAVIPYFGYARADQKRLILNYLTSKPLCSHDLVVVSPDVGGVKRAQDFAKKLFDAPLAVIDHSRRDQEVAKVSSLIGDVRDKVAIMIDDIIDTAGNITFWRHIYAPFGTVVTFMNMGVKLSFVNVRLRNFIHFYVQTDDIC